jgi:hypothetical protein
MFERLVQAFLVGTMKRQAGPRTGGTYRRQPVSTWAFTVLLVVMVGLSWPLIVGRLGPVSALLADAVAVTGGWVRGWARHGRPLRVLGETQEVTLSEVPLLIGLVFAGTDRLLLATVVGTTTAVLWRRQPPIKAIFNVAARTLESVVAAICFHALLRHAGVISLRGSLAAFVAVPAANLVSAVCVQVVITLSVGRFDRSGLKTLTVVLTGVVSSMWP